MIKATGFDNVVSLSMPTKKIAAITEEGITDFRIVPFNVLPVIYYGIIVSFEK
jgi:hypothetical protein